MTRTQVNQLSRKELLMQIQAQSGLLDTIRNAIQDNFTQDLYALRIQLSLHFPEDDLNQKNRSEQLLMIDQIINEMRKLVRLLKASNRNP